MENLGELKLYSDQKLYSIFKEIIDSTYDKYDYAEINREVYDSIVFTVIDDIKNENISQDIFNYFSNKLVENINRYIKKQMIKDDKLELAISLNYIKKIFIMPNDYEEAKREMGKITCFFDSLDYSPSIDLCVKLLPFDALNSSVKFILEHDMNLITKGLLHIIYQDDILASFVETYCMINNINYSEEDSSQIYDDDYSYVSDTLRSYLIEIKKLAISPEETMALLHKYKDHKSEYIKNKIAEGNLRLVVSVAKKYQLKEFEMMDLIQEGNIGLMKAIDRFNPELGFQFSTYAIWWINQSIVRSIDNLGKSVHIPVYIQREIKRCKYAEASLYNSLNRKPTFEEIAKVANMSEERVNYLYSLNGDTVSLNKKADDDSDAEILDSIADNDDLQDDVMQKSLTTTMQKVLKDSDLSEKELKVIILLFGIGKEERMTLEEVGKIFGVTRERIRQIKNKAIKKIIDNRSTRELTIFLDNPDKAMKYLEENKKIKAERADNLISFYEYFGDYSKPLITYLVECNATFEEIKVLNLCYGNNLNVPKRNVYWTALESETFNHLISKIEKCLMANKEKQMEIYGEDNTKIKYEDYIRTINLLEVQPFIDMTNYLSRREIVACILHLGYKNTRVFSAEAISLFFDVEKKKVEELIEKASPIYREIINKNMNMNMLRIKKVND